MSPDGIGHRFSRPADPGPGRVSVDVLAPDGLSPRTRTVTVPPARTVSVPGGTALLAAAETVEVTVGDIYGQRSTGKVSRPTVLAALIGKAAASTITGRSDPERDLQDAALLLSTWNVDLDSVDQLKSSQRTHLRRLTPLHEDRHPAWRPLDRDQSRRGRAALRLIQTRLQRQH